MVTQKKKKEAWLRNERELNSHNRKKNATVRAGEDELKEAKNNLWVKSIV